MKQRQQQRPAKKKKERVHSLVTTRIIILLLLAGVGLQLWHLNGQVAEATAQREELSEEVAQMEQENSALAADIAEGSTVEKMKELARSELGYVDPGEYVFDIIGAG